MPFAYRDARTEGAMEAFFALIPRARIYELTGIQFLQLNSLFQLFSMARDRSPLLEQASALLFVPDVFNYLLTGEKVTEFTFATTSQLYNPATGQWEQELFQALGVPIGIMQRIVPPGTVIGKLKRETITGGGVAGGELLLYDWPVIATASHDTAAAVAAAPGEGADWAYISSGTWSLMGVESRRPIITETTRDLNFTNEGGVGGTFRVLKNIMGLWLLQQCRKAWAAEREYSYEELMEMALAAPPFRALLEPDDATFLNPPDMPEAIAAFCRRTGQRAPAAHGEYVRVILESLALKYRKVLEELRQVRQEPINRIHVIGGGSRNEVLCQFTANTTGLPVIAGPVEATAIGNMLVQALALGLVGSPDEVREIVRRSFPVTRYEPFGSAQDRPFGESQGEQEWEAAYARATEIRGAVAERGGGA
jgi:rhamnulokinase